MAYEAILYEVEDRVATITLNRPERLNAFDDQMLTEWHEAILAADHDPDVGAIIITGAGRGFCSGMNVTAEASGSGVLRSQASITAAAIASATASIPSRAPLSSSKSLTSPRSTAPPPGPAWTWPPWPTSASPPPPPAWA